MSNVMSHENEIGKRIYSDRNELGFFFISSSVRVCVCVSDGRTSILITQSVYTSNVFCSGMQGENKKEEATI